MSAHRQCAQLIQCSAVSSSFGTSCIKHSVGPFSTAAAARAGKGHYAGPFALAAVKLPLLVSPVNVFCPTQGQQETKTFSSPARLSIWLVAEKSQLLHELARGSTLGPLRWLLSSYHIW